MKLESTGSVKENEDAVQKELDNKVIDMQWSLIEWGQVRALIAVYVAGLRWTSWKKDQDA